MCRQQLGRYIPVLHCALLRLLESYWPQLLDLWGRCGVPTCTFKGEGTVGSYKAKVDWYCGNGVWGTCVVPKWDAAQAQLTECTSGPDQSKLQGAIWPLQEPPLCDRIMRLPFAGVPGVGFHFARVPGADNQCGSLDSGEAAFNLDAAEGHETAFQWKWGLSVNDQKPVRVKVGMQASLCRILSTMQQWCRQP
jgi:hypothetical protein